MTDVKRFPPGEPSPSEGVTMTLDQLHDLEGPEQFEGDNPADIIHGFFSILGVGC